MDEASDAAAFAVPRFSAGGSGHDSDLHHPAVSAALATAARLLGMAVVFVGKLEESTVSFERVYGSFDGIAEGVRFRRTDSCTHRMISGAPPATADTANDPAYCDAPVCRVLGVRSYAGVPIRDAHGRLLGALAGKDRASVTIDEKTLAVLRALGGVIAAHWAAAGPLIRRTPQGWEVAGEVQDELTSAMTLADLLAGDAPTARRPPRDGGEHDEVSRLQKTVRQLEYALTTRVVVEQAIGVLTERQCVTPRVAFERLRTAARSRGRRVHDVSRIVVASATNPAISLPRELAARAHVQSRTPTGRGRSAPPT